MCSYPLILENAYKQNTNHLDNNTSTVANETPETKEALDTKETTEVKVIVRMSHMMTNIPY